MSQPVIRNVWTELLSSVLDPWTARMDALEAAMEELQLTARQAKRLRLLDADVLRTEGVRDAARRELVGFNRRRDLAMKEAVDEANKAAFGRAKKVETARERVLEDLEGRVGAVRRAAQTRASHAERQLTTLNEERIPLARNPVLHDALMLDWLALLSGTVAETWERDAALHKDVHRPWERREAAAGATAAQLVGQVGIENVALDAAFGEGPIHVVAAGGLAVVEVREGREGVRAESRNGVVHLLQVRPDGDSPIGVLDGSTLPLTEATTRVAAATRTRPTPVVCLTAWAGPPQLVEGLWLCGPKSLSQVLSSLPDAQAGPAHLQRAAAVLRPMPLPSIPAPLPRSLAHLRTVAIEDVPASLPALLALVTLAHDPAPFADTRLAAGVAA